MMLLSSGRVSTLALVNAIALVVGTAARADDIEAPETSPRVLFSNLETTPLPLEEDAYATSFGIRKGLGLQVVKPIEVNDHKYELKLGGPFLKSPTKQKSLGLKFELRF
jgi:hypothetical protein